MVQAGCRRHRPGRLLRPARQRHAAVTGRSCPGPRRRDWLRRNGLDAFDRYYVSPHARTAETAATLAVGGDWTTDIRWRERDWGGFGVLNRCG
jgi:phosphohistidine phosphatase SixA